MFNKTGFLKEISKNRIAYLMAAPGVIFIVLFSYIPLYYLLGAFKDFNLRDGIMGSPWVGLNNFKYFFSSSGDALRVTKNTLILNTYFILSGLIAQVGLAILITEIKSKFFKNITQTFYFFPYFLSWVVIGEIIYNLFSGDYGAINNILVYLGFSKVEWYRHPEYWRAILVASNIWKGTGYGVLIYLATITGFDESLYEAADVDGASKIQKIWRITLPMLKPTMIVLVLFSLGRIFFGDFGMIYGMVRDLGPLLQQVEVIDSYVYRSFRALGVTGLGMTISIGLFQSVFGFITILIANKLAKKINDGSALF